jgi:hypothetical protein
MYRSIPTILITATGGGSSEIIILGLHNKKEEEKKKKGPNRSLRIKEGKNNILDMHS